MNYTTNSSEYEFDFNQMINGRSPDTGFHTVGPETGTTDWLEQQPVGYRRIYNAMANIPKLDGLVRTANWAFINFTPTPEQSKPLWDLYKARKESLFKRETEKLPVARQAHKYFTQAAEFFDDPNIDFNDKKKVFSSFRSKSAKLTRIKDRFSKGVYSHISKARNTAWTAMNDLILSQQDSGF